MGNLASVLSGVAGGVLGGIATGGSPAGIGMGYSAGSAIGGGIEGALQQKKAEGMELQGVTPLQTTLLNEMRMRRNALETGTMYQPQQTAIKQAGQGAMQQAVKATGGDVGATVAALNKINRGTGRSLNELYGNMMAQSLQMQGNEMQMANEMAKESYNVAAYNKMQTMYDAMTKQKDAMSIIAGLVGQQATKAGITDTNQINKMVQDYFAKIFGGSQTVPTATATGMGVERTDLIKPSSYNMEYGIK